MTAHANT